MRAQDHRRCGRSSIVSSLLAIAALVSVPAFAAAQAAQATATIFGQVTDESGATLPGSSIANLVVNAEPIGSLSLENVGLLDLRV